jgi:hypothetical protein
VEYPDEITRQILNMYFAIKIVKILMYLCPLCGKSTFSTHKTTLWPGILYVFFRCNGRTYNVCGWEGLKIAENCVIMNLAVCTCCQMLFFSSSSSVDVTARCGLWPVEKYLSFCPYLSPTLSIFSLPALEDLFPLLLSIFSWVFLFVSSIPVLE